MINIILLFTLFSLHVGYIIPNSRIITRTSVLNSIKKLSFNLENEYKIGLNLTNIRNEIKKEEEFKTFNISAVREYIRYKLKERNETKTQ